MTRNELDDKADEILRLEETLDNIKRRFETASEHYGDELEKLQRRVEEKEKEKTGFNNQVGKKCLPNLCYPKVHCGFS